MAAPNLEAEKTSFIIESVKNTEEATEETKRSGKKMETESAAPLKEKTVAAQSETPEIDEFDLSDITHQKERQSREDIIAAAEAAAFAG